jgi:hypothetical protein
VGGWALLISFRVLRYDLSIEEIELLFPLVGSFVCLFLFSPPKWSFHIISCHSFMRCHLICCDESFIYMYIYIYIVCNEKRSISDLNFFSFLYFPTVPGGKIFLYVVSDFVVSCATCEERNLLISGDSVLLSYYII